MRVCYRTVLKIIINSFCCNKFFFNNCGKFLGLQKIHTNQFFCFNLNHNYMVFIFYYVFFDEDNFCLYLIYTIHKEKVDRFSVNYALWLSVVLNHYYLVGLLTILKPLPSPNQP